MLFDLRGRGRRRVVQVIYVGLAVLIGLGLIGFGIGGGFGGGGLFTAATNNEGAIEVELRQRSQEVRKAHQAAASEHRRVGKADARAAARSGRRKRRSQNGQLTSKGKELFSQAANSWRTYLALNPPKPSAQLAANMQRIFGEEGPQRPERRGAGAADRGRGAARKHVAVRRAGGGRLQGPRTQASEISRREGRRRSPRRPSDLRLKDELNRLKEHPNGTEQTRDV